MANEISTVFKIGDMVSLKVQPEFKGVIDSFWEKTYNGGFTSATYSESGYDAVGKHRSLWVEVTYLDEKYETKRVRVSILHLSFPV